MSGSPTTGINAQIWMDLSSAGTMAASGTANLNMVSSKNSWTFSGSKNFVDVTGFGDTSINRVPLLPDASGDIKGQMDMKGTGTLLHNILNSTTERALIIYPDITNYPGIFISGKCFADNTAGGALTTAVTLDMHFVAGPSGLAWTGI